VAFRNVAGGEKPVTENPICEIRFSSSGSSWLLITEKAVLGKKSIQSCPPPRISFSLRYASALQIYWSSDSIDTLAQQDFFGCNPKGCILSTTGKTMKAIPG
jgi:hypothetical protein